MVDPTPAALERLRTARGFVLDMDGTLSVSGADDVRALPGAVEFVAGMRARGIPLVVLTNNTKRTASQYAAGLRSAGLHVSDREVLTPVDAMVAVCRRRGHRRVMVIGVGAVVGQLRRAGIEVVPAEGRPEAVDAVFVAWYPPVRFGHIEAGANAVFEGARLYSASQSLFYFTAAGRSFGVSRSIAAAIHDLTGRRIELMGKPAAVAVRTAAERLGLAATEVVVVGDDPELEAPMARRAGALAVGVCTGVGTPHQFAARRADERAHLCLPGLPEVLSTLGW